VWEKVRIARLGCGNLVLHGLMSKIIKRFSPRYIPASKKPQKGFRYPELKPSDVENAKLFAGSEGLVKWPHTHPIWHRTEEHCVGRGEDQ
jgi:hypothetical protein